MTPETQCTPVSSMSSLTQESTRYKKYGVSFDDFIEDNKDWRSFGSITYEGESWIKKHRSHRGHSGTMDDKLYQLYFPYGVDNDEHINDDELALNDNMIEYMNDNVTYDDDVDTWLNMLDNYQRSGRII